MGYWEHTLKGSIQRYFNREGILKGAIQDNWYCLVGVLKGLGHLGFRVATGAYQGSCIQMLRIWGLG